MVIVGVLQADRRVRVPGDLGRQAGPWPPVPDDGAAGLVTAVASALLDNVTTVLLIAPVTLLVCERLGATAGAVPDRRGHRLQHRRHRHPGRRPAEHHHRQPGRAGLQRLPDPPGPDRRGGPGRARRAVPGDVPQVVPLRRRARERGDGAGAAGGDPRPAAARAVAWPCSPW